MSFMKPDIRRCDYYEIQTANGNTTYIPADIVGNPHRLPIGASIDYGDKKDQDEREQATLFDDYAERSSQSDYVCLVRLHHGVIARMSAPGYMDCTDWTMYDSEKEAADDLAEMFGDDEPDDDLESIDLSCDQCDATMIQGVYCHETGCPNTHSIKIDGVWRKTEPMDSDDE